MNTEHNAPEWLAVLDRVTEVLGQHAAHGAIPEGYTAEQALQDREALAGLVPLLERTERMVGIASDALGDSDGTGIRCDRAEVVSYLASLSRWPSEARP